MYKNKVQIQIKRIINISQAKIKIHTSILLLNLCWQIVKTNGSMYVFIYMCVCVQGWQWGETGLKDGIFVPAPHGFFLPHPRPAPHDGENFLPHPHPLRPREAPPYIVKLYFLLIFSTTITIFANKMTYFNNKNILKIINKFILSNQTNFQQKLNNII